MLLFQTHLLPCNWDTCRRWTRSLPKRTPQSFSRCQWSCSGKQITFHSLFKLLIRLFRSSHPRGFVNTNHEHHNNHHEHGHRYHHHHHSGGGSGNANGHLHHSNSTEQNLGCSGNNNCPSAPGVGLRKKSGSLIMEMQNPGYSADLNPEKRQDSIEKQIDNIHVDFGLDEMMTSVWR